MIRLLRSAWLLALLGALLGCGEEKIRIGAKDFTENRILAEMFIALSQDAGLRVVRIAPTEDHGVAFASLRAGTLDVYADYVSTLLGRMGYDYMLERDAALARVTESLAEVGIRALSPLGFDDGYVLVTTTDYAEDHKLNTVMDLMAFEETPRLGVNQGFAQLPNRGLEDVLGSFGLQGAEVITRDNLGRAQLYDLLVDGKLDLVVGFRTDPQIVDYRLRVLGPPESDAPNYDALALVRAGTAEQHPALVPALEKLAGRLDTALMRQLVERVDLDGQAPRVVAREALMELGLRKTAAYPHQDPLRIAIDSAAVEDPSVVRVVRAVRRAAPRRSVETLPVSDPLAAVLSREARTALVPAAVLFAPGDGPVAPDPRFVSVVAAGRSIAHLLAPSTASVDPDGPLRVATGPEGSASQRLLAVARPWLPERLTAVSLDASDAVAATEALEDGRADLALVVATLGRRDLESVLSTNRARLVEATQWLRPAARLALPFLRQAVIPAGQYAPDQEATLSVAMQRVMVGPAPTERRRVLGRGGPSTYSEELFPLPDHLVLALNEEIGTGAKVAPQLAPARVLQPRPLQARAPLNPAPSHTLLGVAILAYLFWCIYLFLRPLEEPHN
jgi:glycine betaine/choline ABC-type transport system substrate-binding protein